MRGLCYILMLSATFQATAATSYDQALALYSKTDYAGAIAILRTLPETAQSLELMGRAYLMNAEFRKASDALEKAVAKAPQNTMAWTWLGRAYGRRAETAFALSALPLAGKTRDSFEKAVQLDPGNREALNDLFEFYIEAPGMIGGGHDKARKLLPLIAKNDPAEAEFALARLAEETKEHKKAEEHLREAVAKAPMEVGRVLDLASFLARRGRLDESEKAFLQAEKMAPSSPKILFSRAAVLIKANRNLPNARNLLKKYLAAPNLTPDDPPRSEALKLLRKAQGA
jgi:tetratricopeptide (TPR) repeat protein